MDNRPTALAQRELAEMMTNSPCVLQQRALSDAIHNSPRMVAQRHEMNALFGGAVRPQRDGAMPTEASPAQREEKPNNTGLPNQLKSGIASLSMAQLGRRAVQLAAMSATMNLPAAQRVEKEEPLQAKLADETVQLDVTAKPAETAETAKPNNTGLPDHLKSGIESLSGMSMDHVKVHYNSPQPAQLNAYAYAQGSEIHVAPGQEQHLPHEAWHVVQQAQGRVQPTMQMKDGVPVNNDTGLEREADVMGARAVTEVAQAKIAIQPDRIASTRIQKREANRLVQKMAPALRTQYTSSSGNAVQLYSYSAGSTKTITLKNATGMSTNIDICTQNSVTYVAGDAQRIGTGTGTASWAGWLTDAGTDNNATQLHVVNQKLGGNGGPTEGNIGPGSQNLNSHHLHQAEKYVKGELFASNKATHDFTYACTFDYKNSVDKVDNIPTAKGTAIGDPAINAKLTFNGTHPPSKSQAVQNLEAGVDVTTGNDMKFGKA